MTINRSTRASLPAIEREETPARGTVLIDVAKRAAHQSPGEAILVLANVMEHVVTANALSTREASLAREESRDCRQDVRALGVQVAQYREALHVEVDGLVSMSVKEFEALRKEAAVDRELVKRELSTTARRERTWSTILTAVATVIIVLANYLGAQ